MCSKANNAHAYTWTTNHAYKTMASYNKRCALAELHGTRQSNKPSPTMVLAAQSNKHIPSTSGMISQSSTTTELSAIPTITTTTMAASSTVTTTADLQVFDPLTNTHNCSSNRGKRRRNRGATRLDSRRISAVECIGYLCRACALLLE